MCFKTFVQNWLIEMCEPASSPLKSRVLSLIKESLELGCNQGLPRLTYYHETTPVFDQYVDSLNKLLCDYGEINLDRSDRLFRQDVNKQIVVWACFEIVLLEIQADGASFIDDLQSPRDSYLDDIIFMSPDSYGEPVFCTEDWIIQVEESLEAVFGEFEPEVWTELTRLRGNVYCDKSSCAEFIQCDDGYYEKTSRWVSLNLVNLVD